MHRRGIAAGLSGLVLMGTLTGCWNGYQAQTTAQAEGGQVASANAGDVQARGMVWVRDPENPDTAYFSGTMLVAEGGQPDQLLSVSAEPGGDAGLTGAPLDVAPRLPIRVGFNGDAFASVDEVPDSPSPFLLTTLEFRDAGSMTVSVLVVPGVGPYRDVVTQSQRELGTDEDSASPSPTESASPSPTTSPTTEPAPAEAPQ